MEPVRLYCHHNADWIGEWKVDSTGGKHNGYIKILISNKDVLSNKAKFSRSSNHLTLSPQ